MRRGVRCAIDGPDSTGAAEAGRTSGADPGRRLSAAAVCGADHGNIAAPSIICCADSQPPAGSRPPGLSCCSDIVAAVQQRHLLRWRPDDAHRARPQSSTSSHQPAQSRETPRRGPRSYPPTRTTRRWRPNGTSHAALARLHSSPPPSRSAHSPQAAAGRAAAPSAAARACYHCSTADVPDPGRRMFHLSVSTYLLE